MPARAASRKPSNRTLLYVGAGVLLLVLLLWLHSRNAAAAGTDTSGTPGPDLSGSAAQQPSGGASNIPQQLPLPLVSQPDQLQQQVQQTDAGQSSQQSATTAAATTSAPAYSYGGSPTTVNGTPVTSSVQIGGTVYEQSAPGSDYYRPVPTTGQQASAGGSLPTATPHRPGLQM